MPVNSRKRAICTVSSATLAKSASTKPTQASINASHPQSPTVAALGHALGRAAQSAGELERKTKQNPRTSSRMRSRSQEHTQLKVFLKRKLLPSPIKPHTTQIQNIPP